MMVAISKNDGKGKKKYPYKLSYVIDGKIVVTTATGKANLDNLVYHIGKNMVNEDLKKQNTFDELQRKVLEVADEL